MATATLPHNELLQPIGKVAARLTGRRPSPATTWRWLHKGCRGAKLNALQLGGQWLCTEDDFRAFLEAQTANALASSVTATDAADAADVDEQLREQGLL